jgi:3',5'-cyclic AMP phosphodiesterase CpdA
MSLFAAGTSSTWRTRAVHRSAAGDGDYDAAARGDYTSTAHGDEFRMARDYVEELARRGFKVIAIPGNHDVYTFESVRARRFQSTSIFWPYRGRRLAVPS